MRFELDHAGLEELLSGREAVAALTDAAREVKDEWLRLDPRGRQGGRVPPKITVGPATHENGVAVVPVVTNDPFWHIIEFGSANNEPYRPATRAAQNVGLDFKDTGR